MQMHDPMGYSRHLPFDHILPAATTGTRITEGARESHMGRITGELSGFLK